MRLITLFAVGCSGALATSASLAGGPPIAFDQFTVDEGDITADCPIGATFSGGTVTGCQEGIASDGMLQREIFVEGGSLEGTYIQFILTEPGVSGDASAAAFSADRDNLLFTNEDFILQHNRGGGIASSQRIIDSTFNEDETEEQRFDYDLEYLYGWANDNIDNRWVHAIQRVSTVDYTGIDPVESFYSFADILVDEGALDVPQPDPAARMLFSQGIDLTDDDGSGVQKFQFEKQSDGFNNYTCSLATIFDCEVTLPGSNGGTLTWDQFETITALWVGQEIDSGGTLGDTTFGLTRFENLTDSTEIRAQSLTDPEADSAYPTAEDYAGTLPIPGAYTFAAVDTLSGNTDAWDPVPDGVAEPVTFVNGMAEVDPTFEASAPVGLLPTVAAGSTVTDTTIVSAPLDYDGWTVAGGVFTLDEACPVEADSCSAPIVNEGGMFQRMVVVDGVEYVQTIVTEETATGDPNAADFAANSLAFKNESFINRDEMEGIATRLHIAQQDTSWRTDPPGDGLPESAGQFVYDTEVKTAWAHGGEADPILAATQAFSVQDQDVAGGPDRSSYYEYFSIKRGETESDTALDMFMAQGNDPSDSLGEVAKPIMHATSIRGGAFNDTSRTLADPDLLPSVGGDIAWDEEDVIQATWVGGNYAVVAGQEAIVNSVSYDNLSTGDRTQATLTNADDGITSSYDPEPESWVSPFDDFTPTYDDPFTIPTLSSSPF